MFCATINEHQILLCFCKDSVRQKCCRKSFPSGSLQIIQVKGNERTGEILRGARTKSCMSGFCYTRGSVDSKSMLCHLKILGCALTAHVLCLPLVRSMHVRFQTLGLLHQRTIRIHKSQVLQIKQGKAILASQVYSYRPSFMYAVKRIGSSKAELFQRIHILKAVETEQLSRLHSKTWTVETTIAKYRERFVVPHTPFSANTPHRDAFSCSKSFTSRMKGITRTKHDTTDNICLFESEGFVSQV